MKRRLIAAALAAIGMTTTPAMAVEKGSLLQVELREIPAKGHDDIRRIPLDSGTSIVVLKVVDEGTFRSGNLVENDTDGKAGESKEGLLIEVKREKDFTSVRTQQRTLMRMVQVSDGRDTVMLPSYHDVGSGSTVTEVGDKPVLLGAYKDPGNSSMLRFYTIRRL